MTGPAITLPRRTKGTVCCKRCRQAVGFLPTGYPVPHWTGGAMCPEVWPAYVTGAPEPARRSRSRR